MARIRFFLLLLALLLSSGFFYGQTAGAQMFPPEIQAIMEKLQRGEALSSQEQKTMMEWSASMAPGRRDDAYGQAGDDGGQESGDGGPYEMAEPPSPSPEGIKAPCPARKKLSVPDETISREAYLDLVRETAEIYGERDADGRREVDSMLGMAQNPGDGSDLGAVLLSMGAGSASIYATAWTALRKPDDFLAANNLGVVLKGMEDYERALKVLRYAESLSPNSFLAAVNLGWLFYEAGDLDRAEQYFVRAGTLDPEAASTKLGRGLIAECRGNHALARQLLSEALARKYSVAGAAAMVQARAAESEGGDQPQEPVSREKSPDQEIVLPDLPVSPSPESVIDADQGLENLQASLDNRIRQLGNDIVSLSRVVARQQARGEQDPGNSVVLYRDFGRELFMFADITNILFGENSLLAKAGNRSSGHLEALTANIDSYNPQFIQDMEKGQEYLEQIQRLGEQALACGSNEACRRAYEKKIDAVKYKLEQLNYESCRRQKRMLEESYGESFRAWKGYMEAVQEAGRDYYAFTSPLLEKVYSPSLNELLNAKREMRVLVHYKAAVGLSLNLPDMAAGYQNLQCVPPKPPQPADTDSPQSQDRKPKDCPFKSPLSVKVIVVSFELDCEKVKIEAGEGLLVSYQRDFTKHETTIGVGVGAQFRGPIASGGAKMGVDITISGDDVTDVGFSSSVSSKAGGVLETELSGRWSLEGGPSVNMQTKLSLESGSGLGVNF